MFRWKTADYSAKAVAYALGVTLRQNLCALSFIAASSSPLAATAAAECSLPENLAEAVERLESRCYVAARAYFEASDEKNVSEMSLFYWGRTALEMGDAAVALKILERAIESGKDNADPETYYWLAMAALDVSKARQSLGLAKLGRRSFQRAIELRSDFARAHFNLASFYLRASWIAGGSNKKATAEGTLLQDLDVALYHRFLARQHEEEERFDEAIKDYRLSLSAKPELGTYLDVTELYHSRTNWKEAFALLDKAIQTSEDKRCFYFLLGKTGALSGQRLETAAEALISFIEGGNPYCQRNDWSADAHWRLGQIYQELYQAEKAAEQYQSAIDIQPKHKDARRALKRLRKQEDV